MKTGSKYYGFKNWNENRVKFFREKEPENFGMKTWIPSVPVCSLNIFSFRFFNNFSNYLFIRACVQVLGKFCEFIIAKKVGINVEGVQKLQNW